MEDLILKCNSGDGTELKVKPLKIKKQSVIAFYATSDETVIVDLTPSQTRELIAHLTNCLKEVEVEGQNCDKCGRSAYSKGKPFCTDEFCNGNY